MFQNFPAGCGGGPVNFVLTRTGGCVSWMLDNRLILLKMLPPLCLRPASVSSDPHARYYKVDNTQEDILNRVFLIIWIVSRLEGIVPMERRRTCAAVVGGVGGGGLSQGIPFSKTPGVSSMKLSPAVFSVSHLFRRTRSTLTWIWRPSRRSSRRRKP